MRRPSSATEFAPAVAGLLVLSALVGSIGFATPSAPGPEGSSPGVPHVPATDPSPLAATSAAPTTFEGAPVGPNPTVTDRMADTVANLRAAGVPLRYAFLPNLNANPAVRQTSGHVVLPYTTAPAPIGVADFGLSNQSGVLVPTMLATSSLKGTFAPSDFSGLSMDIGAPDYYGVQLNAVLQNVSLFGNSSYAFWTQNVLEYSTSSHQLTFLDNVWNFSSAAGTLSTNAIAAHGPNGTQVGTTYYYALGPTITISYPFTVSLYLHAAVVGTQDVVTFNYSLSNGIRTLQGLYDFVAFNGTTPSPPTPMYVADGFSDNALGLPDDFEIAVGGPGGGSNFDAFNASAAIDLYYWDAAHSGYRVVPSAEDVGGETGETAAGLASTWNPGADAPLGGTAGPAAYLGQGPSVIQGEWNVTNATAGSTVFHLSLAPRNGFLFLAPGAAPSDSSFQWAPPSGPYSLSPGTYSIRALASDAAPSSIVAAVGGSSFWLNVSLAPDSAAGVYTPLWALSEAALANASSGCSAGNCTLLNDESGALGQPADSLADYPWFGSFNDYFYPEFPGILLWNVSDAWVVAPPSLEVVTPGWLLNQSSRAGTPTSNDLPILFYQDTHVRLAGGSAVGGWWFSGAYFGPAAAEASVVLWNTSASNVTGNLFLTGGASLYLYGGTNNSVVGNTFLTYFPLAANPGSVTAEVQGTTGIYEADFGNDRRAGSGCDCGDLVYNNAVGTARTAVEPSVDPYTGLAPRLPFDTRWNITPRPGPNIAGGSGIGGNYWWDYGESTNPYWVLPYNASGAIAAGGDAHPLTSARLWTVTFVEQGLPSGTGWEVGIQTGTGTATNQSFGTSLQERWGIGYYYLTAFSLNRTYGLSNAEVLSVGAANSTVKLFFYPLYSLTFQAVNLPADGFWVVTFTNASFGSWIDLGNVAQFPGQSLAEGMYNYTVSPPAGYAASPEGGTVFMDQNRTVTIMFSELGKPGRLVGSVTPSGNAALWVDNQSQPLGPGGSFGLNLSAGLHAVRATAPGYVPYFNNVTINGGGTTPLAIVLTLEVNGTGPTPVSDAYLEGWAIVAAALAAVLAVTTVIYYRRSRQVPPPPP